MRCGAVGVDASGLGTDPASDRKEHEVTSASNSAASNSAASNGTDMVSVLVTDHQEMKEYFAELEAATDAETRRDVAVQPILREWLGKVPVARGARVEVDVDPVSFL